MKARRKLLIGVAVVIVVVLGVVALIRQREPTYHGKKLSYWILKAAEENMGKQPAESPPWWTVSSETKEAILAVGEKGIPFYLKWLPFEPCVLKKSQISMAKKIRQWIQHPWRPSNNEQMRRSMGAGIALGVLGKRAESAIPTLVEYALNDMHASPPGAGERVAFGCLGGLGEPALPQMLELMTNNSPSARRYAMLYSLRISTNLVVKERVRERLQDPDQGVRSAAKTYLQMFGKEGVGSSGF